MIDLRTIHGRRGHVSLSLDWFGHIPELPTSHSTIPCLWGNRLSCYRTCTL